MSPLLSTGREEGWSPGIVGGRGSRDACLIWARVFSSCLPTGSHSLPRVLKECGYQLDLAWLPESQSRDTALGLMRFQSLGPSLSWEASWIVVQGDCFLSPD